MHHFQATKIRYIDDMLAYFCYFFLTRYLIWFILHVSRKCFDWACKGNVYWSAECVKWYWFVVLEVGYGYFTLSSFDNKLFVSDLRRFQKKSSASWEVKMNLNISHQDFLFLKLDIFMRWTIKKNLSFGWIFLSIYYYNIFEQESDAFNSRYLKSHLFLQITRKGWRQKTKK